MIVLYIYDIIELWYYTSVWNMSIYCITCIRCHVSTNQITSEKHMASHNVSCVSEERQTSWNIQPFLLTSMVMSSPIPPSITVSPVRLTVSKITLEYAKEFVSLIHKQQLLNSNLIRRVRHAFKLLLFLNTIEKDIRRVQRNSWSKFYTIEMSWNSSNIQNAHSPKAQNKWSRMPS